MSCTTCQSCSQRQSGTTGVPEYIQDCRCGGVDVVYECSCRRDGGRPSGGQSGGTSGCSCGRQGGCSCGCR